VAGNGFVMRAKPAPVMEAEFTVTEAVPVESNVTTCVVELLTVTLPKLRLLPLTVNCGTGAAAPVPLRATVAAPDEELLLIVSCPVVAPVAVGVKFTCRPKDCPGLRVAGSVPPVTANPEPVRAVELITTGAVPVERNVRDCVADVLTVTLPKARLALLTVSCGIGAVVPLPLSATPVVAGVALLLIVS